MRVLTASTGVALLAVLSSTPAQAAPPTPRFNEIIQVSDRASDHPAVVDSNLVNAWGLALGPTSPLWVANNGTSTATIYPGGINGAPVTKAGLTVSTPDAPTGQAFNGTASFVVTGPLGSGPA